MELPETRFYQPQDAFNVFAAFMMRTRTKFQRFQPICSFIGGQGKMNLYELQFIDQNGQFVSLTEAGYNYKIPFYWLYYRACRRLNVPFDHRTPIEHRRIDVIVTQEEPQGHPLRFSDSSDEDEGPNVTETEPQISTPKLTVPTVFNAHQNSLQSSIYHQEPINIKISAPGIIESSTQVIPVVSKIPKIPINHDQLYRNSRFWEFCLYRETFQVHVKKQGNDYSVGTKFDGKPYYVSVTAPSRVKAVNRAALLILTSLGFTREYLENKHSFAFSESRKKKRESKKEAKQSKSDGISCVNWP